MPMLGFVMAAALVSGSAGATPDPLWLRYPQVSDAGLLAVYRSQLGSVRVIGRVSPQLASVAAELRTGLSGLLGRPVPVSCCADDSAVASQLVVRVANTGSEALGGEGFRIRTAQGGGVAIDAWTDSGALYGAFRLLSLVQRKQPLGPGLTSIPAMELRVLNLWDNADGSVERGYAGQSLIWPMAMLAEGRPPPRRLVFLRQCNASSPWQKWQGATLDGSGLRSPILNLGNRECLQSGPSQNPMATGPGPNCTQWLFNRANQSISAGGRCVDVQNGEGPDIDIWHCKLPPHTDDPGAIQDARKQRFSYDRQSLQIRTMPEISSPMDGGQCLSAESVWPVEDGLDPFDRDGPGAYRARFSHLLRLLKSSGMNGISLVNVNACGGNVQLLNTQTLLNISRNLGPILEAWGIRAYLSVCYAAPFIMANISCSPSNPAAAKWWADKVLEIQRALPTFGGFVVKADSEGNQGPQAFNKTEAEGANLLARALKPVGGKLMWRAFVYGGSKVGLEERAKQAYDTFNPLDGQFDDNVIVQIKNGPMDFQVREPISPLLAGGLKNTNVMMEVQAAHEYTGQALHAVGLSTQWRSYLDFDLALNGTTIGSFLSAKGGRGKGMAAVSNFGNWANLTGHVFAAANAYGFGRLGWDPSLDPSEIHQEWAAMTFASSDASAADSSRVVSTVTAILDQSWLAFEGYTSPLGIGFMCAGCGGWPSSGGCAPTTAGPGPGPDGAQCPFSQNPDAMNNNGKWGKPGGLEDGHQAWHYFVDPCSNYFQQNATRDGIGCDRTSQRPVGTGYAAQYLPAVRDMFNDVESCPKELLLFFHNLPWSHPMRLPNGSTVSLIDYITVTHHEALKSAVEMARSWDSLEGLVDSDRFCAVQARFKQQNVDALAFSEVIVGYYQNTSKS